MKKILLTVAMIVSFANSAIIDNTTEIKTKASNGDAWAQYRLGFCTSRVHLAK